MTGCDPITEPRTFDQFLQRLLTHESGIDPARFAWYREFLDLPEVSYQLVTAPGRVVRDDATGRCRTGRMTVRRYFESLGVADRFDPDEPACLRSMQYAAMNPLGFVGYQLGEAILISTGHYRPERVERLVDGVSQPLERYYSRLPGDATWCGGCREAAFRIPGMMADIVATDVNTWRGEFTGKDGVWSLDDLKSPDRQDTVMRGLLAWNFQQLTSALADRGISLAQAQRERRQALRPDGSTVAVAPTLSGLLAAAHLCGVNATVAFLHDGTVSSDEFGTSMLDYLTQFAGYDTPFATGTTAPG